MTSALTSSDGEIPDRVQEEVALWRGRQFEMETKVAETMTELTDLLPWKTV